MPIPEQWQISKLYSRFEKGRINTNPVYQRPPVWTKAQKQLLIDSILRDYDIPKIYLHDKGKKNFDVIDGQQRIRAIVSFRRDEFALAKDAKPINGIEIAGKKFSELDLEIAEFFEDYTLTVLPLRTQDKAEIVEMFLRLQNGTRLKGQEKRNAMLGKMHDFIIDLVQHEFFQKKLDFNDTRLDYDLIAAQMTLFALHKGICNVKDRDLNRMYLDYVDFDANSAVAKNIYKILGFMNRMFPDKARGLKAHCIISLFILIMDLLPNYVLKNREKEIAKWIIEFESARKFNEKQPAENRDPILTEYSNAVTKATDSEVYLRKRHDVLKRKLWEAIPDLVQLDPKRHFDETDRLFIYNRDNGICQECKKHCDWKNWEADHIIPWSEGGRTDPVTNGQVLCPTCNAKKKDKLKKEEE